MENHLKTILIIDDDSQLRTMLAELLHTEQYDTALAADGMEGLSILKSGNADLVVLDVMMPKLNGFDVLDKIREFSAVPVIMLTARGEDLDRITGFEHGADDYLAKPFNPRELLLRIKAILKRGASTTADEKELCVADLRLEPHTLRAFLRDQPLSLTGAELKVLEVLMRSPGQPISREKLTKYALGRKLTPYDRALDTHISNLRAKIGKNSQGESPIRSIRGEGYVIVDD